MNISESTEFRDLHNHYDKTQFFLDKRTNNASSLKHK